MHCVHLWAVCQMQLIVEDLTWHAIFPLIKTPTQCYDEDWHSGKGRYSKKMYKLATSRK